MVHSVDEKGNLCVNLNEYAEYSDSIRLREKIDHYYQLFNCPKEITHFSITMRFRNGERYYLSNLYLWAIPYRTEGLHRGDKDHDVSVYRGKEFFIQRDLGYDDMQIPIIQVLESRYSLHTTFAMIRESPECDFIIEAYHNSRVELPEKMYRIVRDQFERFIVKFLDAMIYEINFSKSSYKTNRVVIDAEYRNRIITRKPLEKLDPLSPRELECLAWIQQGKRTKEMSELMFISEETVITHTKSIRRKLKCSTLTQAVAIAITHGLLE